MRIGILNITPDMFIPGSNRLLESSVWWLTLHFSLFPDSISVANPDFINGKQISPLQMIVYIIRTELSLDLRLVIAGWALKSQEKVIKFITLSFRGEFQRRLRQSPGHFCLIETEVVECYKVWLPFHFYYIIVAKVWDELYDARL